MVIEPTIIINYKGEIAKRITKNLKKEFPLESFEILREDFLLKSGKRVDFQLKVKDINDMDILIANYYIDNPIIQQLKDFNNKVVYFAHNSQTEAQLLDVSRYLSCDVNYLREIELAKTVEIRKVLSTSNNFNTELSYEVSNVSCNELMDLHSLLIEKYDTINDFDSYDLLMNSINSQLKDHEIINFNRNEVKAYFMSDGYYIYQGKMNLIVYDDNRLNPEVERNLKTFLFDEYLDAVTDNEAVANLIIDYLDDIEEVIGDLILGVFDKRGSGTDFYEQIKHEILIDETMDFETLLEYIELSHHTVNLNGRIFSIYYRY